MFDGRYLEQNQKRIKGIIDYYGHKYFFHKTILDMGCGHGDIGGAFYRLGADLTLVDARQEHLNIALKKFPGIKIVRSDLDAGFQFANKKFDIVFDLDLICHLQNFEQHLRDVCAISSHLVLETAVCDSNDPIKCITTQEHNGIYDLSFNGMGSRPTAANVERILTECGMNFKRAFLPKYNCGPYVYDWETKNDGNISENNRRMWFAVKVLNTTQITDYKYNQIVFSPPEVISLPTPTLPISDLTKKTENFIYNKITVNNNYNNISDYAILIKESFKTDSSYLNNGTIQSTTISGSLWLNKIKPLFPNIKINNKSVNLLNQNSTEQEPDVLIGSLKNLQPCKKIWLEEFQGVNINNDYDYSILNSANTIMSPSIPNIQYLRRKFPNKKIIQVPKFWPLLEYNKLDAEQYLLYFEKNIHMTEALINSWDSTLPKLLVVGSSVTLPNFAKHISKYLPYQDIFDLILNSRGLIDLNINSNYYSGILDLAHSCGINIVTNNQWLAFSKPVPEYLPSLLLKNNMLLPKENDINIAIKKMITKPIIRNKLENYNLNLESSIRTMLVKND